MNFLEKKDWGWVAALYGTAVGAGILYLPAEAIMTGVLPLIIISVLAGPIVWLGHKNLMTFCMKSPYPEANITDTVAEKFGKVFGGIVIFAYFFSMFPILILYSITLTNSVNELINHFFGLVLSNALTSFVVLSMLTFVILKGEKWILSVSEILVVPLILIIAVCTLYFIPLWKPSAFSWGKVDAWSLTKSIVYLAPLIVFSFNFAPACSAFSQAYRLKYGSKSIGKVKVKRILVINVALLLFTILPFILSCVFSMNVDDAKYASDHNIPALLTIASSGNIPWLNYVIQFISILAIASSFIGTHMGSHEGAAGLTTFCIKATTGVNKFKLGRRGHIVIHVLMFLTAWLAAIMNFKVVSIIKYGVSPVLSIILFIMPVIAKYSLKEFKNERSPVIDFLTVIIGVIIFVGFIFG